MSAQALGYVRAADRPRFGTRVTGRPLELSALVGAWHATDKRAGGVVRLALREQDGGLLVRAFGADTAEPYDWGEVEAVAYGNGVSATEAMAFSAGYRFDFLSVLLAAYAKQGILVLDTFNTFTDGSGRVNYFSREFFHR
jgi:hypothetical protein